MMNFDEGDAIGYVVSVDTTTAVIEVTDAEKLKRLQVNRLVALDSIPGQHQIGLVQKITRKMIEGEEDESSDTDEPVSFASEINFVRISLIGTLFKKRGLKNNVFSRSVECVPQINAGCFPIEGDVLSEFMKSVSQISADTSSQPLYIGRYTLEDNAHAYLNGDKFFQRHAIICGSTGSGKSWTTAQLLEQIADLDNGNAIVIDIHGEYKTLQGDGFRHFRIAGPSDLETDNKLSEGVIYLPYWLLPYEAMIPLFIERSDSNAINQVSVLTQFIRDHKERYLTSGSHSELLASFTVDSPIPFEIRDVLSDLIEKDNEKVEGAKSGTEKLGPLAGKLTRLVSRLEGKILDRRLGFIFSEKDEVKSISYVSELCKALLLGKAKQTDKKGGVKIIDFSEVPSDVLPLMVSMIGRIVFSVQQWTKQSELHPLAIFCDEAHNYLPDREKADAASDISISIFERIAKEGRKFGIGLMVISQRPSEVNRTILSQCNNVIAMRLTNADDQARIRALLPDSLGGIGDLLPVLDVGEGIIVGDASLLPSRVRINEPKTPPASATMPFWERWSKTDGGTEIEKAVRSWQLQRSD